HRRGRPRDHLDDGDVEIALSLASMGKPCPSASLLTISRTPIATPSSSLIDGGSARDDVSHIASYERYARASRAPATDVRKLYLALAHPCPAGMFAHDSHSCSPTVTPHGGEDEHS